MIEPMGENAICNSVSRDYHPYANKSPYALPSKHGMPPEAYIRARLSSNKVIKNISLTH